MKAMNLSLQLLVFLIVVIATQAFVTRPSRQGPGRNFPTFPGQGPFNPSPTWPKPYQQYRFRRSPDTGGSVTGTVIQPLAGPERQPSVSLDYNHRIFENEHGSISATAGAQKFPGQRWEPNVGLQGSFRFRRSPEPQPDPQGSLSATWQKNLSGPERRPAYNLDYQHRIFENKHGSISATAGAQKFPGQRWEPNVGLQGSFRFRRSAESQPELQEA